HRLVDVFLELGECNRVGAAPLRFRTADTELREGREHVFPTGELGMESCANLQQRVNVARNLDGPGSRLDYPCDQLQKRALPRAVPADHSHFLPPPDFEID